MTMADVRPNPGSREARDLGCRCPVVENGLGRGAFGGVRGEDGRPVFVVSGNCPMHATKAES